MTRRTATVALLGIAGFLLLSWGMVAEWQIINPWYAGADKPIGVESSAGFDWHSDAKYLLGGVVGVLGALAAVESRLGNLLTLGAGIGVPLHIIYMFMPVVRHEGAEAFLTGPVIYGPALYLLLLGSLLFITSGLVGYAPALRSVVPSRNESP